MVSSSRPWQRWFLAVAALVLLGSVQSASAAQKKPIIKPKPKVEVVFCLDTTGSMGGLLEGAKQKIWSISNQIANGKPVPELKIGLVAYRDRGDAYITQVFDLNDDLDAIHGHLRGFKAEGGDDVPESVNQALDDAVNKIKWSTDKHTLRIIFLVGDAPPHMDYANDVKYTETCKKAATKEIIINTIQCGNDQECRKFWQDICVKAEGTYVQIPQAGGVVAIATPFDKRLAEINGELTRGTLVYGNARMQAHNEAKKQDALALSPAVAADRAAFAGKAGQAAAYDLLDAIRANKVDLKKLKKEELPPQLQKLSPQEQKTYLEKLAKQRDELRKEAIDLDKKRSEYIAKEQAKKINAGKGSAFDDQVLKILRKQAHKYNISY